MRKIFMVLTGFVLLIGTSTSADSAEKKFEKKFSVSPGGSLTVGTDVGSIRVAGGTSNEVSIVVNISGRSRDVDNFEVQAEQKGNTVEIRGKTHKGTFSFLRGTDLDVEFVITVPHEYSATMRTSGGDVEAKDLKGKVKGETSGGNISVGGVEGDVDLETSGGNASATNTQGNVHLETSGGDIHAEKVVGDIDVSTSGGNVKVSDVEGKVRASTSGGNVMIRAKGSNKGIHAETSGGDIDLYLSKSVSATIDAGTSGGDVTVDLPITVTGKISDSHVRGTVNGGGNTVYAHTSGGSIRIRSNE
jgi:hypothetical protein